MITVEAKGLEQVQLALRDSADRLGKEMRARVLKAGLLVQREAKEEQISKGGYVRVRRGGRTWIVPTPPPRAGKVFARRGGLRRSINVQTEKRGNTWISRVGTPLKYGAALEFGAPGRTFAPRIMPLAVLAANRSAKGWRTVTRSGPIRARRWLQKSFEAKEAAILSEINRGVVEAIK